MLCIVVTGIITSGGCRTVGERLYSSGTRLDVSPPVVQSSFHQGGGGIGGSLAGGAGLKSSTESVHHTLKSVSRQSLLGEWNFGLLCNFLLEVAH